jgi:cellulose synthase operon protein C
MAKSLVDKYEQILAQDPASTAFVELAKALIEKEDHARAIDVCRQGLSHHSSSVVGRVLWGKALISLGRPAEAMEQFDQAIAINRDNPHAYNLISEVLLQKRLYRSALPLLRKAVALQPNDGRLKSWLEQTQAALSGGPAPVLTSPEEETASSDAEPGLDDEGAGTENGADGDGALERAEQSELSGGESSQASEPTSGGGDRELKADLPVSAQAEGHDAPSAESTADDAGGTTPPAFASEDLGPGPATASAEAPEQSGPPVLAPAASVRSPPRPRGGGLLDDLPDEIETSQPAEAPKPQIATQAVEAIARDYEKELRAKFAETVERKKKSFVARHGLKLAAAGVVVVAVGVAAAMYAQTLSVNRGSLPDVLAEAKKSILLDTRDGYTKALDALGRAVRMDEESAEAWALTALARALAFAEHGGNEADRAAARVALAKPGVRERFRPLAIVADWYLADPAARPDRDKQVLEADAPDAELNELAGRILLSRDDAKKALQRFQAALSDQPNNVRALVALGDYYRSSGDFNKALEFYVTAGEASRLHPQRVLAMAESQLELGRDLATALAQVEQLPENLLTDEHKARRVLMRGRLLTATGEGAKAVEALAQGPSLFPSHALDFHLALGNAQRRAGRMADAQRSFEAALSLQPSSEEVREALGRVLIDRDRPQEALAAVPADAQSRKISLMRGIAYTRLRDWKKARAEFERTQVKGRFPLEAVIHLALADAAQGEPSRAQGVLEKTLALTKKAKSEILVAIGEIHLSKGDVEKAKVRFAQAAKDPDDMEGSCAQGRLLLRSGASQAALEPLQRAAARNDSHREVHEALARAYTELGRTTEALETVSAAELTAGSSAALERTRALALYLSNSLDEAAKSIDRATRLDGKRPEVWRLRAEIEFARADGPNAMKSLERANKLDPKDPETFCAIGHAFLRQGNTAHAEKAYQAALGVKAGVPCARVGIVYTRLGSAGKPALKELEEVASSAATVWDRAFAQSGRARVLLAMGKVKEAREAAEEAVRLGGGWSSLGLQALGLVAAKQKDVEVALDALTRAVAADPLDGAARLALGDLFAKGSDDDQQKALEQYDAFLQIGGEKDDEDRVERTVNALKKRLAAR